jgi:hypothetical protein
MSATQARPMLSGCGRCQRTCMSVGLVFFSSTALATSEAEPWSSFTGGCTPTRHE